MAHAQFKVGDEIQVRNGAGLDSVRRTVLGVQRVWNGRDTSYVYLISSPFYYDGQLSSLYTEDQVVAAPVLKKYRISRVVEAADAAEALAAFPAGQYEAQEIA